MPNYKYLIVGGGIAADSAVKGIRQIDSTNSIGIIAGESHPPYKRPPLSKGLWKGKPVDSIWLDTQEHGVDLVTGRRAERLDPNARAVTDDQGTQYSYEKLLLATGGTPRRLTFEPPGVIYFRTFDDYLRLRGLTESGDRFAVIGGGFIGSEIAAALAMNGKQVKMIFPEESIGARVFPRDLSRFLHDYYREHGVDVVSEDVVAEVEEQGGKSIIRTLGGRALTVEGVVAGLGIDPNTQLADAVGLRLENGIYVDEFLRSTNSNIYAAGDVANFYNPLLGSRVRVEHIDNAVMMGECAGRSMAGRGEPYNYLPFFYSDLFDLGYEAVGEIDSRLETFADWKEPFKEGVVYYLRDGRVRGVLLWNVWDKTDDARKLMAEPGPFAEEDLEGMVEF